jgi:hypothetical protein
MKSIYLIHWNADEAEEKATKIRKLGYDVARETLTPTILCSLKNKPPDIFLIDLSRLPSQGRDVALSLRQGKVSRYVPLVFVDGEPEKVANVKKHLPDAVYTTWESIKDAIEKAISHPPLNPVVPRSALQGYENAPLAKKLGIKANFVIALINAPVGFRNLLNALPENVKFIARGKADLVIWFVKSEKTYRTRLDDIINKLGDNSGLWIAWPKQTSGVKSDLTQNIVRQIGLATGLVDYKVCSIDKTWSGLKFRKRKPKK